MSNKVEKGQKYKGKGSGDLYEILSDPFDFNGRTVFAYLINGQRVVVDSISGDPALYTLIREPKFKVGDKVIYCGDAYEVVVVSPEPDQDGDFAYIGRSHDGFHAFFEDHYGSLKAAE